MKIKYEEWSPKPASLALVNHCNAVITQYEHDGLRLTLRQLYYRLVASDIIPNTPRSYKNLGAIVNKARLAGLISWEAIEDRGRFLRGFHTFESPEDFITRKARDYKEDVWSSQRNHVEVWVEKDALIGVIGRAANKRRVDHFSCRGYTSVTAIWEAAQRFGHITEETGKEVHIIHLGDHDPSGLDMTRDIEDRLRLMIGSTPFFVHRIALSMAQIEEYEPPPNPAKLTDSRIDGYMERYGTESWELDALEPAVLDRIIIEAIDKYIDRSSMDAELIHEEFNRDTLSLVADYWGDVEELVRG